MNTVKRGVRKVTERENSNRTEKSIAKSLHKVNRRTAPSMGQFLSCRWSIQTILVGRRKRKGGRRQGGRKGGRREGRKCHFLPQ